MSRSRLVLIALLGHAPGIWLFTDARLDRPLLFKNALALLATAAAMLAAYEWRGGWAMLPFFLVGHVAWGTYLAFHVSQQAVTR